jgi:methionyl-tRNA formyltransferase
MNIIFFANGNFAINSLNALINSNHNILAVVTNKDKRIGRGLKLKESLISNLSTKHSLEVLKVSEFNDFFATRLKELNADIFVVISYRILPNSIYTIPRFGSINIHTSILPEYRGAAPIQRSLMDGKNYLGLSSFFLNDNVDKGDIIDNLKIDINERITYGESIDLLSEKASFFLINSLKKINDGGEVIKQDYIKTTYAKKIKKNEYNISLNYDSKQIHNKIRALTPPGCHVYFNNKRVKIFKTFYNNDLLPIGNYKFEDNVLYIGCKNGCITTEEIQFEGKSKISINDFKNMNFKDNTIFK